MNAHGPDGFAEVRRLKRVLWRGTLLLDLLYILGVAILWPGLAKVAFMGCALGLGYLWSLFFNAEHPKRKIQFAFSLTRIMILAYGIVYVANGRMNELALVICGFLSYKVILAADATVQVVRGLGRQAKAKKLPSKNALNPDSPL